MTNATALKEEFLDEVIVLLAEYIKNKTNAESSNSIAVQLKDKLDRSELDVQDNDQTGIRGTVELLLKNLPLVIQTVVSNIEIVMKLISLS